MKELKTATIKPKGGLRINKQFYIILVCLFIASVFWFLLALSHEYSSTVTLPVNYLNIPGKKVVMNELPSQISVRFKTSGFKIISLSLQKNHQPVEVDVTSSLNKTMLNSDVFSISTQSFLNDFSRELGKDVTITGFQPDSIIFNFSDIVTKKIPVVLSLDVSFEKQYDTTGSPKIFPKEIEVSGPPAIIAKLKSIRTENIKFENLKDTVKKKVKLLGNRFLSYNVNEIEFVIPVEKFTESSAQIEIHPLNVGLGYSLKTFPDKIKVIYLVALSQFSKVEDSMFVAVVDASNLNERQTSKLEVNIVSSPSFIRITNLEPGKVDYILRKQ